MRPLKIVSAHNHFIGAVWAAVHNAQKSRNKYFHVVRLPGKKRWSVVGGPNGKASFTIKSYHGRPGHIMACTAAGEAIRRWETKLYKELIATGKTTHIPRRVNNNTHENLLKMAVVKNNATAVAQLIGVGADVNYHANSLLRIAVRHNHQESVLALLRGGASIKTTQKLHFIPPIYGPPKQSLMFLERLVGHIKFAGLDENLPIFDELAEIAQEPACRKIIEGLTGPYPRLLAKLL
jgi:hypothetical protein